MWLRPVQLPFGSCAQSNAIDHFQGTKWYRNPSPMRGWSLPLAAAPPVLHGGGLYFWFYRKRPFTNTGRTPLFCSDLVHITHFFTEGLQIWKNDPFLNRGKPARAERKRRALRSGEGCPIGSARQKRRGARRKSVPLASKEKKKNAKTRSQPNRTTGPGAFTFFDVFATADTPTARVPKRRR